MGEKSNKEPSEIVKKLRKDMNLNRREFCDYFNIPYRTVQDWECGKRVMPDYVLRLLEYKIRTDQMLVQKGRVEKEKKGPQNEETFGIRRMQMRDYMKAHKLWMSCDGIGLHEMDDSKVGMERFLLRNPDTCFVAEQDGDVAGVILAGNDGRRGYIYHLAVSEEYRGKGIATRLVETAVDALNRLGIQKTALVVYKKNTDGNALWEKMGVCVREGLQYRDKVILELE